MMAITIETLKEEVVPDIIKKIKKNKGLSIFAKERAKFEGWLKVELVETLLKCASTEEKVIPEQLISINDSKRHIDIAIEKNRVKEWGIELKTVNTNYSFEDVEGKSRPITLNIESLLKDISKLRETKYQNKAILFIVFPLAQEENEEWCGKQNLEENKEWCNKHVDKIRKEGIELIEKKSFKFNESNIPGVIYLGLIK